MSRSTYINVKKLIFCVINLVIIAKEKAIYWLNKAKLFFNKSNSHTDEFYFNKTNELLTLLKS